jgi:hypothetical protein
MVDEVLLGGQESGIDLMETGVFVKLGLKRLVKYTQDSGSGISLQRNGSVQRAPCGADSEEVRL